MKQWNINFVAILLNILKLKENAKHFPFSFSYAERNSGYKFANTEESVQALFRLGIVLFRQFVSKISCKGRKDIDKAVKIINSKIPADPSFQSEWRNDEIKKRAARHRSRSLVIPNFQTFYKLHHVRWQDI